MGGDIVDCLKARAGLWPPERPRLVGDEVAAARKHVRDCRECDEYFAQDRALLDLYDRARRAPAPLTVRERVFDALARARWETQGDEHTQRSNPQLRSTAEAVRHRLLRFGALPMAMAAVLALVLVGDFGPTRDGAEYDPDMFVEDYLRRAVGQDHIETSDPAEVVRFLQRELGLRIEPLRSAGLDLQRAEICLLEGRRGAMIVYKQNGTEVAHYLIPREDAEARVPALSGRTQLDPSDMPVVTWATPRVEQALVGELDSERLLQIAGQGSSQ